MGTLTRYFYDPDGVFDHSTFQDYGDGTYQILLTLAASLLDNGSHHYALYATDGSNVFLSNPADISMNCASTSTTLTVPTTEFESI
jgi:hypothetical protein